MCFPLLSSADCEETQDDEQYNNALANYHAVAGSARFYLYILYNE